jgi:tRNA-specific 2-thiouridylase
VACNRHLKFGRLLGRARVLGFDAVATGHHARVVPSGDGHRLLLRGVDGAKDQSYVVSMLTQDELAMVRFPVGALTKAEVRATAARLGLRTAAKPDSQDVCFISRSGGREAFLGARIPLHPGRLVDGATGEEVGTVDAVELVTVGQRRRLGAASAPGGAVAPGRARRYAVGVDVASATVTLGPAVDLMVGQVAVSGLTWVDAAVASQWCDGRPVEVQCSAHGRPARGVLAERYRADGGPERGVPAGCVTVVFDEPQRRVAPGQSVVLYDGEAVLGAGVADGDGGDRRVGP